MRRPLSGKRRAATLFRIWHGLRELNGDAERLGDGELVHFLEVALLLVEEKVAAESSTVGFGQLDTSRPN